MPTNRSTKSAVPRITASGKWAAFSQVIQTLERLLVLLGATRQFMWWFPKTRARIAHGSIKKPNDRHVSNRSPIWAGTNSVKLWKPISNHSQGKQSRGVPSFEHLDMFSPVANTIEVGHSSVRLTLDFPILSISLLISAIQPRCTLVPNGLFVHGTVTSPGRSMVSWCKHQEIRKTTNHICVNK